MFNTIDLFSGAGGLSLGFMQTNMFSIKVAIENNKYARQTYVSNHPNVDMLDDVRKVDYTKIIEKHGNFDVVIGGPPCQGFSNANRQKNHTISINNRLVKEYVRAIRELNPKAFVLENVGMFRSESHRFLLSKEDMAFFDILKDTMRDESIELLPKGIDLYIAGELIRGAEKPEKYEWNEKQYLLLNSLYKLSKNKAKLRERVEHHREQIIAVCKALLVKETPNKQIRDWDCSLANALLSYCNSESSLATDLFSEMDQSIMVQRMLSKLKELRDNGIVVERYDVSGCVTAHVKSFAVLDYLTKTLGAFGEQYVFTTGIMNAVDYGVAQKRQRYIVIGVKEEYSKALKFPNSALPVGQYKTVSEAISDLENILPSTEIDSPEIEFINTSGSFNDLNRQLRNSQYLRNHVITATTETAMKRFQALKQGQNFHDLSATMKSTYSDAKRTQNTIYMRLKYDEPSSTVVNVRKSMWIHPVLDRALSIREAARLQSFPDNFTFMGPKDSQYQQVGNAVPPFMANAIAKSVINALLAEQKTET